MSVSTLASNPQKLCKLTNDKTRNHQVAGETWS